MDRVSAFKHFAFSVYNLCHALKKPDTRKPGENQVVELIYIF